MEIKAERDLFKDVYGNYYLATNVAHGSLTLVNAALYYAYKQALDEAFITKVQQQYPKKIAVGKYFADLVDAHIEKLQEPGAEGGIYTIEEAKEHFDLHIKPIYDHSFHV
ncbi:hypothetical protein [Planococcus chinensis]|uniref:Uncharacterized protein n=1 Tax=Planococcus chinensis TaxID=272917 RepID=A0ABW4QF34_9BACL